MPAIILTLYQIANVKGLKLTKKRIKIFEYSKSKLAPSGVQGTHSTKEIE